MTQKKWTQLYFLDFLANVGGLFTSLMAVLQLIMSGYQNFTADKSMLKRLYGEEEEFSNGAMINENINNTMVDESSELMRSKIQKR